MFRSFLDSFAITKRVSEKIIIIADRKLLGYKAKVRQTCCFRFVDRQSSKQPLWKKHSNLAESINKKDSVLYSATGLRDLKAWQPCQVILRYPLLGAKQGKIKVDLFHEEKVNHGVS